MVSRSRIACGIRAREHPTLRQCQVIGVEREPIDLSLVRVGDCALVQTAEVSGQNAPENQIGYIIVGLIVGLIVGAQGLGRGPQVVLGAPDDAAIEAFQGGAALWPQGSLGMLEEGKL